MGYYENYGINFCPLLISNKYKLRTELIMLSLFFTVQKYSTGYELKSQAVLKNIWIQNKMFIKKWNIK